MLKTKPVRIDDQLAATPPGATLAEILPFDIQSVTTPQGALITRDQFARVPVPAGFDTNLTAINKGDGDEAQHDRAPARMPRLRAANIAIEQFFATNPVWRWFVIGLKLSGLTMITAGTIVIGFYAGQFLLLHDDGLRSGLDLAPDDNDLTAIRTFFIGAVVVATALTLWAVGSIRRLWRQTLGTIPLVQRILARAKFIVELLKTIMIASNGGLLVWIFLPLMVRDWGSAFSAFLGFFLLGWALHSVLGWVRSGREGVSAVRSGNVTNSRVVP